ncbi:MAG: histidine triad nucleotide-binding protein [Candidatus Spechtbacteria bacterium RIFCSPHIGHO2_02_FULL_43_15b]|uniref:Histidine triad nucleotide-binding protein n=1 Tax=Candidatus Spechtbacteria bacterium RIFCSPHIGHO2_01_FULL_43_30 TaxID=1802158 RepID=A0A1G2H9X7_9BACT|nr:MAG: histidine triad nucleotide-binding protein [Candidatus Spechtbacteria bacterium RIFCSPHIGHO2_01_FULL_43_30]OGZ59743.1 MAG: histidine triad nucleotide-binding protein [Candidatus Spechtbacteria bacterium RIFCSPHIGHO2_02_FULL_43_15b]
MCIFCQIVKKEKGADIVFESERVVAFRDINPKAPTHILVVPKKHIGTINDMTEDDRELVGDMVFSAKIIAKEHKIDDGYKLAFNVGSKGGQIIDHIHLHLLGGKN